MLRRTLIPVLIGSTLLTALLAGCGGSDPVDDLRADAERTASSLADRAGETASSIAGGAGQANEFTKVDGTTVRVVNGYSTKGAGTDIDVYWGRSASTGKLATTVPFGTISDPLDLEVEANPVSPRADGEQELAMSFYPKGVTEGQPLVVANEVLNDDTKKFVAAVGPTSDTGPDGNNGGSVQLGQLDQITPPPAGKALVVINTTGVQAVDGGDFLTLSPQGQCDAWDLFSDVNQVDANTGNLGTAYAATTGSVEVVASDANTDCATGLPPVNVDITDGGLYVLYAYGTTIADRQLLVLDASE